MTIQPPPDSVQIDNVQIDNVHIKTETNVQIDAQLAAHLISSQFPQWADLPVSPVKLSGWDNRTFHLGDRMSIRLPSGKHYAKAIEKEQLWLPKLEPRLPLPIPRPIALGHPDELYPWQWSVYLWIEGEVAKRDSINNLDRFAVDLADFLLALQDIDIESGPPGKFRGGSLDMWIPQTELALRALEGKIDTKAAAAIWKLAIEAPFEPQIGLVSWRCRGRQFAD